MSEGDEVPIVRIERPVVWFDGTVATLPPPKPYISPDLIALAAEDAP